MSNHRCSTQPFFSIACQAILKQISTLPGPQLVTVLHIAHPCMGLGLLLLCTKSSYSVLKWTTWCWKWTISHLFNGGRGHEDWMLYPPVLGDGQATAIQYLFPVITTNDTLYCRGQYTQWFDVCMLMRMYNVIFLFSLQTTYCLTVILSVFKNCTGYHNYSQ